MGRQHPLTSVIRGRTNTHDEVFGCQRITFSAVAKRMLFWLPGRQHFIERGPLEINLDQRYHVLNGPEKQGTDAR